MSDFDSNIYYNPDKSGLRIIACLNEENLSYEYNTLIVLLHDETGKIYWAHDSGCSCPTPFEEYFFRGPNDTNLNEVNRKTLEMFYNDIDNFPCSPGQKMGIKFMECFMGYKNH